MSGDILERWLEDVICAPGATGLTDIASARQVLLEDALRAASLVERVPGRIVDVGSGGGSPGIPLAVELPQRPFVLLEAERRKCVLLEQYTAELPNVDVVWGRAEEQPVESFGVALAKALAKPAVATELCLPLVEPGGAAVLWLGQGADRDAVARVAELLGGRLESDDDGIVVVRKVRANPVGYPRRPGMAKKRPLG